MTPTEILNEAYADLAKKLAADYIKGLTDDSFGRPACWAMLTDLAGSDTAMPRAVADVILTGIDNRAWLAGRPDGRNPLLASLLAGELMLQAKVLLSGVYVRKF